MSMAQVTIEATRVELADTKAVLADTKAELDVTTSRVGALERLVQLLCSHSC